MTPSQNIPPQFQFATAAARLDGFAHDRFIRAVQGNGVMPWNAAAVADTVMAGSFKPFR